VFAKWERNSSLTHFLSPVLASVEHAHEHQQAAGHRPETEGLVEVGHRSAVVARARCRENTPAGRPQACTPSSQNQCASPCHESEKASATRASPGRVVYTAGLK